MILTMRYNPDSCQVLPPGDTLIISNSMSFCDTVIFFGMPVTDENDQVIYYEDVRGYHASGGIANTNWNSLFEDYMEMFQQKMWIFGGTDNTSPFGMSLIATAVDNVFTKYQLRNVSHQIIYNVADVTMNNKGEIVSIRHGGQ